MAAAAHEFNVEVWTLLAVGSMVTILRTYARIKSVGLRRLQPDDFLVWIALIFYAAESALAYSVGEVARGMANNGMTDAHRAALPTDSEEFRLRVVGSQIQLAGWSSYSVLLWSLKAAWLVFYLRLTEGLGRSYRIRIYIGFVFVVVTWMVVLLNLFLGCRPFNHYWQINPNPGNTCQPAVSNAIIWVYWACNVSTDLYLLSIPLPLLWGSRLPKWTKTSLIFLFSGGIFIVVCATLRCVFIVTNPIDGAQLAGAWAVRETFVAVVTTNLPLVFTLVKGWLSPLVSRVTTGRSSQKNTRDTPRMTPTFGAGRSWRGRGPPSANPIPDFTMNESEERMVYEMKHMEEQKNTAEAEHNIHKSVQVAVVREERQSPGLPRNDGSSQRPSDQPWEQAQTGHSTFVQGGRKMSLNRGSFRH
ncbi:hypothetical protein B0I35DRAFT_406053 [Stachybotrys elegans]|uniref:Rhodopsin domain-containing protein n=1 Tax=Stachybotrys elegans TaxID=80388 RepID=A0A8K0SWM1_9HYPO|nr:hypothetical protein B0I35DRAFT_406053 [Stachybotrys elegans]